MEAEMAELNSRAREEGRGHGKKRFLYPKIKELLKGRVFIGIAGPRGAGKTVMLKQLLSETESSFYISLDSARPAGGLFNTAKELEGKGIKLLLLDEVHTYPGFDLELKKIYDFLSLEIVFTSSSAIKLRELSADLSRRARILPAPPFTLREYIYFEKDELLPEISIEGLRDGKRAREYYGKTMHAEGMFEQYLKGRNYAFALGNNDLVPLFRNMLDKVVNRDLALSGRMRPEETLEAQRMLAFIGASPAEDISYSSISRNLGITKYKAEKYVDLMERAFILMRVMPKGTNVTQEPKILMCPPYRLLYKEYDECIGALREDFFVEMMKGMGYPVNYLKSGRGRKMPDYLVGDTVFEIGGTNKSASQLKGFSKKERVLLVHPGALEGLKRPLYFAGMLGAGRLKG